MELTTSQRAKMPDDDELEDLNEQGSILNDEEWEQIDEVRSRAKADRTLQSYEDWWKRFLRWVEERGLSTTMPIDAEILALYLTVHKEKYKINTLEVVKKAVRHSHLSTGFNSPTDEEVVVEVMAGLKREKRGEVVDQAEPLTRDKLAKIIKTARLPRPRGRGLEREEKALERGNMDIALVHVQFDGMLRIDELVELQWGDVEYNPDGKSGVAYIRHSKTDQEGKGAVQWLSPGAMSALAAIRPKDARASDEIFPFDTRIARMHINRAAFYAGLGEGISGHSARVGMTQELVRAGIGEVEIIQAGRWKNSDMVSYYSQKLTPSEGAVAQWYRKVKQGDAPEKVRIERPPITIRAPI